MESPSTRRVTRSQTRKMKEGERFVNSRIGEMRALSDITNDSPIIGLAKVKLLKTPSSEISKKAVNCKVQGSGESLLRGQVKTLLQKVEENTEISEPMNIFDNQIRELASVTPCLFANKASISQMGNEVIEEKKDFVTRSLLFDFMEKLDEYESSEESKGKKIIDDSESSSISELCEGMSKMNIEKIGKHTRFVYDSDGELIEVEEEERIVASPALELRGLPKPEGKHIRFNEED